MENNIRLEINIFNYEMEKASRFLLDDEYINYNEDFASMKQTFSRFMDKIELFFKRVENMLGEFFNGVRHITDKRLYELEVKVKRYKLDKFVEKRLMKDLSRKLSFIDIDKFMAIYDEYIDSYTNKVDKGLDKIKTPEDLKRWNNEIDNDFKVFYKKINEIGPSKRIDFTNLMSYTAKETRNRDTLINFITKKTSITNEKIDKALRNKYDSDLFVKVMLFPIGGMLYESPNKDFNFINMINNQIQMLHQMHMEFTNRMIEQTNNNINEASRMAELHSMNAQNMHNQFMSMNTMHHF